MIEIDEEIVLGCTKCLSKDNGAIGMMTLLSTLSNSKLFQWLVILL